MSSIPAADLSKTEKRRLNAAVDNFSRRKRADGAVVRMRYYDVIVRFPQGGRTTILKLEDDVSNTYSFATAQWAPDGEWALVTDSVGRLLIVASRSPQAAVPHYQR